MTDKEKTIREYLQTLTKDCVIELCLQYIYDKNIAETQLEEKDKEIEDLKEWQDWYSMWHKKFQKQIEDLTTELETYRPTKLHGNGQCECFKCKQEGRQAREWTDWCSRYKGHTYCDDCLKEVLKEEQDPQTQLAIQELEKVKDFALKNTMLGVETVAVLNYIYEQIKELSGGKNGKF